MWLVLFLDKAVIVFEKNSTLATRRQIHTDLHMAWLTRPSRSSIQCVCTVLKQRALRPRLQNPTAPTSFPRRHRCRLGGLGSQEAVDAEQMLERLDYFGYKNKRKKAEGDSQSQSSLGPGTQKGQDAGIGRPAAILAPDQVLDWPWSASALRAGRRSRQFCLSWRHLVCVCVCSRAQIVVSRHA